MVQKVAVHVVEIVELVTILAEVRVVLIREPEKGSSWRRSWVRNTQVFPIPGTARHIVQ